MISVIDLHKNFETPQLLHVLRGIHLEIAKGELLCIVGASGVGKSTFLHLLGGLDRPTLGKILYEGQDIARLNENQLADFRNKKIGFVFQFHHLLPEFTALENAMMPALIRGVSYKKAAERAQVILRDFGLSQRIDHKPGELSGGEQQRVAVARALCMEPQVVLADEPTGNLDTHTGDDVFALLKDLNKRKALTLVIVTHNEKLSAQADRVVRMVDGKIEPA
jgi:lipoprotein-releasing system ATP-binding protein